MLIFRLAGDHLYGQKAVHLAIAGDVFDGVFLCCPFSQETSWMRSGTKLSQFSEGFPSYSFCGDPLGHIYRAHVQKTKLMYQISFENCSI